MENIGKKQLFFLNLTLKKNYATKISSFNCCSCSRYLLYDETIINIFLKCRAVFNEFTFIITVKRNV